MLNTWVFMAFIIISWLLYWFVVPIRLRALFLALISFGYFFAFYPRESLFLLGLAVTVYGAGFVISKGQLRLKWLTTGAVVVLVLILGYFKYSSFLAETLNVILQPLLVSKLSIPQLFIPIGISYFTFKMIHYLVDVRKGKVESHQLAEFLSYIFFFPILVSGPIERFQPFLAQTASLRRPAMRNSDGSRDGEIDHNSPLSDLRVEGRGESAAIRKLFWRGFDIEDLYAGLPRIISGLFKKMVLADSLAATAVLLQQPGLTASQYWLASFAYTLQLYFDFAGYSDMAIGISRLFGYRIMENFNWPYLARNVSDFWKRWHMSLTGWFRDYLFIPLGGSRGTIGFVIRNTLIVMAVTGLWHGAGWHFVFWGLYHAAGLIILRLYRKYLLPRLAGQVKFLDSKISAALGVLITFNFVNIGWIFFACEANQSIYVLTRMFVGP